MQTPSRPSRPSGGHSAAGPGFYVWYETRLEAEAWRSDLAAARRRRTARRPAPAERPLPPTAPARA